MIKPLTSLRFFFALCVFVSHLSFLKGSEYYANIFETIFDEGFLGVSFFFILSGFILAYNYEDKILEKKITKKEFYISRIARIYPMHFVTMLAALIISSLIGGSGKYVAQNILLVQSFFPNEKIFFSLNAPSWSISNEMFFYLIFPFVLFLSEKTKIFFAVLFVVLITLMNVFLEDSQKHYWLYISPLIRFADFLLGIILFSVYLKLKRNFIEKNKPIYNIEVLSIFVFVIFFIFHNYIDIGYRYSIYYWIPMFLIILAFSLSSVGDKKTAISKFLSNKHMVWLGEISFCFYLIHLLVIKIIEHLVIKFSLNIDGLLLLMIILGITIIASAISYKHIEKPLNRKVKEYLL